MLLAYIYSQIFFCNHVINKQMIFHLDYHFSYEFENEKEPETKQNKTK